MGGCRAGCPYPAAIRRAARLPLHSPHLPLPEVQCTSERAVAAAFLAAQRFGQGVPRRAGQDGDNGFQLFVRRTFALAGQVERVARDVVDRQHPARAAARLVVDDGIGQEPHRHARPGQTDAVIDILAVHKQRLIKIADLFNDRPGQQHTAESDEADLPFLGKFGAILFVAAQVLDLAGGGVQLAARKPNLICRFHEEHLRAADRTFRRLGQQFFQKCLFFDGGAVEALIKGGDIVEAWKKYSDESVGIVNSEEERHNTCTPIVRYLSDNKFCLEIILRNNSTSDRYPDGVFHAHPEYHNIKKEGIGLIEAMGLYILPGRLKKQTEQIADILTGDAPFDPQKMTESDPLFVHKAMITELKRDNPVVEDKEKALEIITKRINETCVAILENTAVFKKDETGTLAFRRFLNTLSIK